MPADDDADDVANRYYDIDRVIQESTRDGEQKVLVKWTGYSHKFTSWEPASRIYAYYIEEYRAKVRQKQLMQSHAITPPYRTLPMQPSTAPNSEKNRLYSSPGIWCRSV